MLPRIEWHAMMDEISGSRFATEIQYFQRIDGTTICCCPIHISVGTQEMLIFKLIIRTDR